jgi:hypothetical protein
LDRETGLVWEKQPGNVIPFETPQDWANATYGCQGKNTGGRKGWRLPTIEELGSLVDETLSLPLGHPFLNVHVNATYWSVTKFPGQNSAFVLGFVGGAFTTLPLTSSNFYWCVRGPGGANFAS